MSVLRTEFSGMRLFYDLFVRVFCIWLTDFYMSNWTLWVAMTCRDVLCYCCISKDGTKDNGWLFWRLSNCGALGVVFLLSCEVSYAFGVVDSFSMFSFIWASRRISLFEVKNFSKTLRITCALQLLVCLLMCVLRMCYRFLSIMRRAIQKIKYCV